MDASTEHGVLHGAYYADAHSLSEKRVGGLDLRILTICEDAE
jgi:hypothetical protein